MKKLPPDERKKRARERRRRWEEKMRQQERCPKCGKQKEGVYEYYCSLCSIKYRIARRDRAGHERKVKGDGRAGRNPKLEDEYLETRETIEETCLPNVLVDVPEDDGSRGSR